jgi:hypothetical protein
MALSLRSQPVDSITEPKPPVGLAAAEDAGEEEEVEEVGRRDADEADDRASSEFRAIHSRNQG